MLLYVISYTVGDPDYWYSRGSRTSQNYDRWNKPPLKSLQV